MFVCTCGEVTPKQKDRADRAGGSKPSCGLRGKRAGSGGGEGTDRTAPASSMVNPACMKKIMKAAKRTHAEGWVGLEVIRCFACGAGCHCLLLCCWCLPVDTSTSIDGLFHRHNSTFHCCSIEIQGADSRHGRGSRRGSMNYGRSCEHFA